MSIAAVMLARDEDDILAINLRHHLPLVDHLFVIDNGSSDGTPRVLRDFARRFPHLRWTTDTSPFYQSKLLTQLAHDAWEAGDEWVFSIDADEFWRTTSHRSLRAVLEDLPPDVGALEVPVTHYVQARWVERRHRRALLTMTRRAPEPVGPPESADQLVAKRHTSFVEAAYAPKLISRTGDQLSIGLGNHSADGLVGSVVPTSEVVCLHAPLRSFANLVHRAATGDRVENEEFGRGTAWQARRWAGMTPDELAVEWRANSYDMRSGALDVHGFAHPLVDDELLRDTVLPHFSLRDRAIASLEWRRHSRASR
jgi:hypothetical protein